MTCIPHYNFTQNDFTDVNILCDPPIHPSIPLTSGSHRSFCCLYNLPFLEYLIVGLTVCSFLGWLLTLINMHLRFLRVLSWLDSTCIYFQHGIIFHCLDVPRFIHSPMEEHLGCFQLLAVMNKATISIHLQVFVWKRCQHLIWIIWLGICLDL